MGYEIKRFRKALKMSQEELSEKSGISRRIISELESGKRTNTTAKTLVALANALNTTIDNIFFVENV